MAALPFRGNEDIMPSLGLSPDLLAYGDSWFWYPNSALLIPINAIWGGAKTLTRHAAARRLGQRVHPTPDRFRRLGECLRPLLQQLIPGTP